jgi:tetratricopeptide (TPR) repeat protein
MLEIEKQAYCSYYIGLNFKAIGEYEQALPHFENAQTLCDELTPSQKGALERFISLYTGICYEALSAYNSAIINLHTAAMLFEANNDTAGNGHYLRAKLHYCRCIMMEGDPQEARLELEVLESQPNLYADNVELRAMLYQLLGMSQILDQAFSKGQANLEKAKTIYKDEIPNSERQLATIAQYMAIFYLNSNQSPRSVSQLITAQRYFEAVQDLPSMYFINLALAINYQEMPDFSLAKVYLTTAAQMLERYKDDPATLRAFVSTTQYFLTRLSSKTTSLELENLKEELINTAATLAPEEDEPLSSRSESNRSDNDMNNSPHQPLTFLNRSRSTSSMVIEEKSANGIVNPRSPGSKNRGPS